MRSSVLLLLLASCTSAEKPATDPPAPILAVPETERWEIPGLACDAHVVRTAGAVPHVYAHDRVDLARAYGFTQARDRYFEMELARRLGRGTVSELLGDAALETDMESRASGMTWVGDNILANLSAEHAAIFDGFAEGVNAYIALVRAGDLPPPSELEIAGPFLGATDPASLLVEWTRADLAGVAAVLVYELGYETDDVSRAYTKTLVEAGLFDTETPLGALRQAGVESDIAGQLAPVWSYGSAAGWGLNGAGATGSSTTSAARPPARVNGPMLARLATRLERFEDKLGRGDLDAGWGSNVWAVGASVSADGTALLAGDGHLPLSVPSLFWQIGLDTSVLGGGDTHQMGLGIPGLPILAVGTNGKVAWSQTQLMGDITDWYAEQLQLGSDGLPAATLHQGTWQPVASATETHTVAAVLGGTGGTVSWKRYTTFDGRWIADIEGTAAAMGTAGAVDFPGGAVVPGDIDGDGVVTAIAFDYTAFSDGNLLNAVDRFGHSENVEEMREATKYLVAYSQNIGAADSTGSVLYTGYQAVPCRSYLPRDADGRWVEGADPMFLLDGTTYGGFEIPIAADGMVDESGGTADPYRCVVPWADYPTALDPAEGYIVNGNNDPGSITLDNDLWDEPWYIGGPWVEGWRAYRIAERIDEQVAAGTADVAGMAAIQADRKSALGTQFGPHLVAAIQAARAASEAGATEGAEGRLAIAYAADAAAYDEVETRLSAWIARGGEAESGVLTFYHSPTADQVDDSVATTLFNAWLSSWDDRVFADENLPGVWNGGSTAGRVRALTMFLDGRGPGNPGNLASWNPDTEESVFFDDATTPDVVETSDEVALASLADGLTFLRSAPGRDLRGTGFGTTDMAQYKWGLRHWTRFESVLADFVDAEEFSFLTDQFSISTEVLPLAGEPGTEDIPWFPRPGDNLSVDAANSGWGTDWTHGSGPVFRMVIALGPDGKVTGQNVIPGGQSSLIDSPHFADQTALWLANDTLPMLFHVEDVVADARGREVLVGAGRCE